jgi:hypothetical protein
MVPGYPSNPRFPNKTGPGFIPQGWARIAFIFLSFFFLFCVLMGFTWGIKCFLFFFSLPVYINNKTILNNKFGLLFFLNNFSLRREREKEKNKFF